MPRVSVAMPVYNREKYVAESIESVLNQTYTDFEFLICDDGSTDGTWDILKKYETEDKRIKLFKNEANLGISRTLNKLISYAQGEYLARQDSDDLWLKNKLKIQVKFLDKDTKYDFVASNCIFINEFGRYKYSSLSYYSGNINKHLDLGNIICHSSVVLKLKCLKNIFPDGVYYRPIYEYAEDYDLWCRLKEHIQIYNLKEKLVTLLIHEKNMTKDGRGQLVADNITFRCLTKLGLTDLNKLKYSGITSLIRTPYYGRRVKLMKFDFVKFILSNKKFIHKHNHLKIRLISALYFNPHLFNRKLIWLLSPTAILKSLLFSFRCLWDKRNKIVHTYVNISNMV